VPDLDARVALLERWVQEHAAHMTDLTGTGGELRQEIRDLRQEMRQAISELREEMRQLRDETRQAIRDLLGEMLSLREEMDRRFDAMDRRFTWLAGMMVTGFLAVIGTVAGASWGLLQIVR
jgi:uncharacterized coiled-coil DUF342 family protein